MKVTVIGTTDLDYTTAWHYAAAFEKLGHEVDRVVEPTRRVPRLEIAGVMGAVHVGRLHGLMWGELVLDWALRQPGRLDFFVDDGVWAAQNPTIGPTTVHYLRSGCHGPEAHDSEPYPPWQPRWDVAFIGSSPGHREWPHRAELVFHLREWFGDRFIHVGPGGHEIVDDSQRRWGIERPLRGHWLNRLLRSVPVTIGDSVLLERRQPYFSERVYETWARGGFLIHPSNEHLEWEIGDYPGLLWKPGDWEMLKLDIDWWLNNPVNREQTRQAMQEFVRTHCTYEHRAAEMLTTLGIGE